ncbi:MAG: helix-turn-helix transcriptional regulator [Chitinophagaceae bacterium]|nr:helix-turn-helix transcriptional regulator [Chitinophagaceae bacterium]MBP6588465.1 helix-turn-helix transcriptional regulator [Chitinophagaceae bacterium]
MKKKIKGLTPKESAILELLTTGLLYKEIAARKSISIDTVKKHCKNIYKKVNARNRVEAINNYQKTTAV